jgi:drug/metabolite transporter (DMT)-like permease
MGTDLARAPASVLGLAVGALVLNALVWGTSWWPFRQLHQAGLHPLWTTVWVYGLAAAAIACVRPRALRELAQAPILWVLALASGLTNACFNWAVTVGDVVRVVLLFYLMPLWSVLLARWLLREPITVAALLRIALALLGAALVLTPAQPSTTPTGAAVVTVSWPWPRDLADALGLLGGFCFALNNVVLRREAARSDSSRSLAMFVGGVAVAGLAGGLLGAQAQVPWPVALSTPLMAGLLGLTALFLVSNLALQYGASRLAASTTALIMLSEVVFATVSAWWWGAGELTPRLVLGGLLIVGAAGLATLGGRKAPVGPQALSAQSKDSG